MRLSFTLRDATFAASIVLCSLVLVFAVSGTSLWIDEGFTAWTLSDGSLPHVISLIANLRTHTDRQYPLYDLWEWFWIHRFGSSEYELRLANLPPAGLYVLALALTSKFAFNRSFSWIPFVFVPFVWFYINEARAYLMLTAFATCATGAMVTFAFGLEPARRRSVCLVLPCIVCALATHILAIVILPGLLTLYVTSWKLKKPLYNKQWRTWLMICMLPLVSITTFQITTLVGIRDSPELTANHSQILASTLSPFETAYEQIGFGGLGPGRNILRTVGVAALLPQWGWLAVGLLIIMSLTIIGFQFATRFRSLALLVAWFFSLMLPTLAAFATRGHFIARHMSAALPLLIFAEMSAIRGRLVPLALLILFGISDFRMAVMPEYAKDDYRDAAEQLILLSQHCHATIDWAADDLTASYYRIKLIGHDDKPAAPRRDDRVSAIGVANLTSTAAVLLLNRQLLNGPVFLAISKPDIFDRLGGWSAARSRFCGKTIAKYPAFEILRFENRSLNRMPHHCRLSLSRFPDSSLLKMLGVPRIRMGSNSRASSDDDADCTRPRCS